MPAAVAYLVVIDGCGEHASDFSVIVYRAASSQEAVERAIQHGYGSKVAYVAKLEDVLCYGLGEQRTTVADKVPWGDIVAGTSEGLRQFIDPDGLAHTRQP